MSDLERRIQEIERRMSTLIYAWHNLRMERLTEKEEGEKEEA